jgi:hypothetical protein
VRPENRLGAGRLASAPVSDSFLTNRVLCARTPLDRRSIGARIAIAGLASLGALLARPMAAQAQTSATPDASGASTGSPPPAGQVSDTSGAPAPAPAENRSDLTGGAYTTPTLLFIPAAAVPQWNVRIIASTQVQGPAPVAATVQPGLGVELGLPAGFTLGAGTNWVGGDVSQATGSTDFNLGISPYFQARYHILGEDSGRGWQLGSSLTYKFVGFEGDPGELELAASLQYRELRYEFGVQAVLGQDFEDAGDHDAEVHVYAVGRPIPQLALGAAGQVRISLSDDAGDGDSSYDVIGGAIASLTIGRFQVGVLAGETTVGLRQGQVAAMSQVFATARF